MKRLLCAALAISAFVAGNASAAIHFITTLDSAQEVSTGSTSPATGIGTLSISGDFSLDSGSLEYTVTIDGLDLAPLTDGDPATSPSDPNDVTAFHIHNAARGVNGGVVYGIFGPDHDVNNNVTVTIHQDGSATIVGSWDPEDGDPAGNINSTFGPILAGLMPGQDAPLYFNFHTVQFGGGAIRGQIVAVPEPGTWALLAAGLGGLLLLRRRIL